MEIIKKTIVHDRFFVYLQVLFYLGVGSSSSTENDGNMCKKKNKIYEPQYHTKIKSINWSKN